MVLVAGLQIESISNLESHERSRALQRAVVCLIVGTVWAFDFLTEHSVWHRAVDVLVPAAYLVPTLLYLAKLKRGRAKDDIWLYVFLILDPVFFVFVLVIDPRAFASLYPLLLVILVRCGIRYGLRAMYLAWAAALAASPLLLLHPTWRTETALAFAYFLMLLCVPVFFGSLVRRVHEVRAIEAERATLTGLNELVVARSVFLSKVSHELRSPLQGIVSALDLLALQRGSADADGELIDRIRRSSMLRKRGRLSD
jgi:signal transduction histidine kinase